MNKDLSRRSFMIGCGGLLTFTTAGVFFTGCGSSTPNTKDKHKEGEEGEGEDIGAEKIKGKEESTPPPSPTPTPPPSTSTSKKITVKNKNKNITLSSDDFNVLKTRGYVESASDRMLVFYYDNKFYGYSSICPHEKGVLKIDNKNSIKCTKHLGQFYDGEGKGNGYKTSATLKLITLNVKMA